jgi:anti-anti-sigma factor
VSHSPGTPFQIDVSSTDGSVVIVAIVGELDIDAAPELSGALDELLAAGTIEIVVDVSELSFIDSSGISALVAGARSTTAAGGTLVVASPTPHVQRVFDIVSLSELVAVEGDRERALQRIGWRPEQSAG